MGKKQLKLAALLDRLAAMTTVDQIMMGFLRVFAELDDLKLDSPAAAETVANNERCDCTRESPKEFCDASTSSYSRAVGSSSARSAEGSVPLIRRGQTRRGNDQCYATAINDVQH